MKIIDRVYGEEKINEQVLVDLINSDAVQRLKGISQWGLPDKYHHKKNGFLRFEHSLGVLFLLRKLDANMCEQIAGLTHDVSHTAFSHVIDWLIGDPTREDYQDKNHFRAVENSEIPTILEKHNFDWKDISDIEKFSLLEMECPDLCADRLDYSLRELVIDGKKNLTNKIVSNLSSLDGQIIFENFSVAKEFSLEYLRMQNEHWAGTQAKTRYFLLAEILKRGLEKNIICMKDFYKNDDFVLTLLENSDDKEILKGLDELEKGINFVDKRKGRGVKLKKKFRYVNPLIFIDGKTLSLSELDKSYGDLLNVEKEKSNLIEEIYLET